MKVPTYNLEWQDPPAADEAIITNILAQLQNNPGRWARISRERSQTALVTKWQKLGTEARHVRLNPGESPARYDIYARWPKDKPATVPNAVRDEIARKTAGPAPTRTQQAVQQGRALTPAPATGGYLAARAARGINPEGTMP